MPSYINASSTGTGGLLYGGDATGNLELQTNGSTALTVTNAGLIGIGTTSPAYKLDIKNAGTFSGLNIQNTSSTGVTNAFIQNTAQSLSFGVSPSSSFIQYVGGSLAFSAGGSDLVVMTSSGSLGIGTGSPVGRFDATNDQNAISRFYFRNPNTGSSAATFLNLSSNSGDTHGEVWVNGSNNTGLIGGANAMVVSNLLSAPLVFSTNNTERIRIGPLGQLGIGGANYGSSGQVLTSQGSGAAPVWASVSGGVTSLNGQTGAITNTTVYAIGSYVIGRPENATSYNINTTIAGSSLLATTATSVFSSANGTFTPAGSTTLINTGTWRLMSTAYNGAPGLWVRIS